MNFNSLAFLIFLPVVLLLYWILPHRFRWVLLLVASYYFYMSWNPWLIFLILATTLVSYLSALFMGKSEKKGWKRFWLIFTIVVCIGSLIFFKYFNFLIKSATDFLNLFSLHINSFSLDIVLPIGISFYTFQTLSYVIDVYRGKFEAERHIGYYALFVCYFPQLVAGPIERPKDLIPQLKQEHRFDSDDFFTGLRILLVGFFYKCAVADVFGIFVNKAFADVSSGNTVSMFLTGFLFTIQMYCDFAGYSEIATGAARMMGVRLSRNFNRPYMCTSYSDFFRRWHITLTRWFTSYVYIPLGGNRKGTPRRIINTYIVFLLCGLWHGANWTYVLWGLYAATFMSLEILLTKPVSLLLAKMKIDPEAPWMKVIRVILMYPILIPAALIFRSSNVMEAGEVLIVLFTRWGLGQAYFEAVFAHLGLSILGVFQIVFLSIAEVEIWHYGEIGREEKEDLSVLPIRKQHSVKAFRLIAASFIIVAVGLSWIALLGSGDASAFQYFQF